MGVGIFSISSGSGLLQGFPAVARALGLYSGAFSAETLYLFSPGIFSESSAVQG